MIIQTGLSLTIDEMNMQRELVLVALKELQDKLTSLALDMNNYYSPVPVNYNTIVISFPDGLLFYNMVNGIYNTAVSYYTSVENNTGTTFTLTLTGAMNMVNMANNTKINQLETLAVNTKKWLNDNYVIQNNTLIEKSKAETIPPVQSVPVDNTINTVVDNAKKQAANNPLTVIALGVAVLKLFHIF
jgi:hypothetical protein